MYILYSFRYDKFGSSKGATFFKTKEEAENYKKLLLSEHKEIKVVIEEQK